MKRSKPTFWLLLLILSLLLPSSVVGARPLPLNAEAEPEKNDGDDDGDDDDDDDGDDDGDGAAAPPWTETDDKANDDEEGESQLEADANDERPDPKGPAEEPMQQKPEESVASTQPNHESWKGGGMVGLGFLIGTDNGLSLKLWPRQMHGIHIHLAAPTRLNAISIGLAYQIHLPAIAIPGSTVQLHPSIGPSFRTRVFIFENGAYVDGQGGASIGMSISMTAVPAELFFEVVPGFTFGMNIPGVGLGFDVGGHVGARFYFGK